MDGQFWLLRKQVCVYAIENKNMLKQSSFTITTIFSLITTDSIGQEYDYIKQSHFKKEEIAQTANNNSTESNAD